MTKSRRSIDEVSRTIGTEVNLLYKWKSEEKSKESLAETLNNAEIVQLCR